LNLTSSTPRGLHGCVKPKPDLHLPRTSHENEVTNIPASKMGHKYVFLHTHHGEIICTHAEKVVKNFLHTGSCEIGGGERRRNPDHAGDGRGQGLGWAEGDKRVEGFKDIGLEPLTWGVRSNGGPSSVGAMRERLRFAAGRGCPGQLSPEGGGSG
jgi:hypothetical protein